ncbi:MAG: hypothetical protein RIR26_1557 [Pseudomonadota bacterium]|jgi:phosphoribosylamine--glycine ligase
MKQERFSVQFGKVRVNTKINTENRVLTSTNRISAFDSVLPFDVDEKGQLLQAISVFFFTQTRDIIPNHFVGCLDAQSMLVKSGRVLPLEVIARGTLTGSLWRSYKSGGPAEIQKKWGIELPEGLQQHARFQTPLITFTTKAAFGHDLLVSPLEAKEHVRSWLLNDLNDPSASVSAFAESLLKEVTEAASKLFLRGQEICRKAELLMMDTKYEFALDPNNTLMLVDEIHTPDASRFVDLKSYEAGNIEHLSKEWLREKIQTVLHDSAANENGDDQHLPFVLRSFWNKNNFKSQIAAETSRRYRELFHRLFPDMKPWDVVAPHLIPWPVDPVAMRRAENQQRLPSRILVVGNGGRDFTLSTLLERQPDVDVVYCWPGRASWTGGKKRSLGSLNRSALVEFCKTNGVGWAVFGPEMPIAQGMAEDLRAVNIPCLAPDLEGARLEVSKIHTKQILNQAQCPTAESWVIGWNELKNAGQLPTQAPLKRVLDQYPYVLKYESLASGKGVCLVFNEQERDAAVAHFAENLPQWMSELNTLPVRSETKERGEAQFLIEKLLPGKEISAIALCHGEHYLLLPFAQDYKRRNNQQTGPNTGGMGAVCPVPVPDTLEKQIHSIFQSTLKTLSQAQTPYRGFLFAGLMLDEKNQAQVLEFNCRMGDPETQVILPGLGRDLVLAMWLTSTNDAWDLNPWLNEAQPHTVRHDGLKRCFVVLAAPEYPNGQPPVRTLCLPETWPEACEWIPSGVDSGNTTRAGRMAGVLCSGLTEAQAVEGAYSAAARVTFAGTEALSPHFRTDIDFPRLGSL